MSQPKVSVDFRGLRFDELDAQVLRARGTSRPPTSWHMVYDIKGTTGIARGLGAPSNRVNHTGVPGSGRVPTTLRT